MVKPLWSCNSCKKGVCIECDGKFTVAAGGRNKQQPRERNYGDDFDAGKWQKLIKTYINCECVDGGGFTHHEENKT